jgi:hypothetical protein
MTKKTILASTAVAAALVAGLGSPAASHDDDHRASPRRLKATLSGFNEYPSTLSTTGRGSFQAVLSRDETSIEYRLRFSGLEGNVTQSHIHSGDRHTAGGVSVWLCGTATNPGPMGTPPCVEDPSGDLTSGDVTGTLTAAQVGGPSGQGIAAGEFEELVSAIRRGVTYVNVHSSKYPGGEIRGQIRVD